MSTDMTVPETILRQLGGSRFSTMTGAKGFCGDEDHLSFRLPSRMTRGRASGMRIVLEPDDTYRMETFRIVKFEVRTLDVRRGVHVEQLRGTFTDMSGLDTSLGRAA